MKKTFCEYSIYRERENVKCFGIKCTKLKDKIVHMHILRTIHQQKIDIGSYGI